MAPAVKSTGAGTNLFQAVKYFLQKKLTLNINSSVDNE